MFRRRDREPIVRPSGGEPDAESFSAEFMAASLIREVLPAADWPLVEAVREG